jgi:hypothetical protein
MFPLVSFAQLVERRTFHGPICVCLLLFPTTLRPEVIVLFDFRFMVSFGGGGTSRKALGGGND